VDPLTLAIITTLAGSGLQMYSQNQAAKRQQQAALESQQRQLAARNQTTDMAAKAANEFDPATREQNAQDATQQLTQQYERAAQQPGVTAQGLQIGATVPDGSAGADYTTARAREAVKTTQSLRALAGLMGRIGGASKLRQDEAVKLGDTAGNIERVQRGAENVSGIDQIGIQAAGQQNPWTQIAGAGLQAYGLSGLATAGLEKAANPAFALAPEQGGTGLSLSKAGTGLNFGSGGLGLKQVPWMTAAAR
jgi:hypothetical protein